MNTFFCFCFFLFLKEALAIHRVFCSFVARAWLVRASWGLPAGCLGRGGGGAGGLSFSSFCALTVSVSCLVAGGFFMLHVCAAFFPLQFAGVWQLCSGKMLFLGMPRLELL